MKLNVITKVTKPVAKLAGKAGYQIAKHSPEILLGAGIVGVIAGTVMFIKAAPKAEEVLKEFDEKRAEAKKALEDPEYEAVRIEKGYDIHAYRKELAGLYAKLVFNLAKVYALPVAVEALSCGLILGAHGIMCKRVAGLSAAFNTVTEDFNSYREAVIADQGEEADMKYRYGTVQTETEMTTKDGKGKTKVETVSMPMVDPQIVDTLLCFCKETSDQYTGDPNYDRAFLENVKESFNFDLQVLKRKFCINDVLDKLGMPLIDGPEGQLIGWSPDKGDGYVDFRVSYAYVPVYEPGNINLRREIYFLDFNHAGYIYGEVKK